MKIKSEQEILDASIRKKVIEEIDGPENEARKNEALRRFEIFKDRINKYVRKSLESEFEESTIQEMLARRASINLLKKVVSKKARVYQAKPLRVATKEDEQDSVDRIYDFLNADKNFKRANKFLELNKNTILGVLPVEEDDGKWSYRMRAIPDHLYDVIENANDPERPLAIIINAFTNRQESVEFSPNEGRGLAAKHSSFREGDQRQQAIADSPADEDIDNRRFIWWTKNYHFTTDAKGNVIEDESPDDLENPIGMLPFADLHKDQDGSYWAQGGEDLVDGTVLTNVLLTDTYYIAKLQGYGLFFFFAKNPNPNNVTGPGRALVHSVEPDDPAPSAGFISANPPIADHLNMIEQYVALMLTTNDMSVSSVSTKLDGSSSVSGIQELISKSEATDSTEDDEATFLDAENKEFTIIKAWHNFYHERNLLIDDLQELGRFQDDSEIKVSYEDVKVFETESVRLKNLETKINLGLMSKTRAIMAENPGMTMEEAEEELLKILEEKLRLNRMVMINGEESNDESEPSEQQEVQEGEAGSEGNNQA